MDKSLLDIVLGASTFVSVGIIGVVGGNILGYYRVLSKCRSDFKINKAFAENVALTELHSIQNNGKIRRIINIGEEAAYSLFLKKVWRDDYS